MNEKAENCKPVNILKEVEGADRDIPDDQLHDQAQLASYHQLRDHINTHGRCLSCLSLARGLYPKLHETSSHLKMCNKYFICLACKVVVKDSTILAGPV